MNEQMKQIATRMKELREILDLSPEEIAKEIGIPTEEYLGYESAEKDIPVSALYAVAAELNVDPTVLLTGEAPRMDRYTLVRKGGGVSVDRCSGYNFRSLAFNFKGREMEPMIVTLNPNDADSQLISHGGQEFNMVLKGSVKVVIGKNEFILNEGDSIYFDPSVPHGQHSVGEEAQFLTIINDFIL